MIHRPLLHRIQRLVARKMGVPDTAPVPAALAFLADQTTMQKSFDKYLAGTDLYRAKLKQWEEDKKLKPDLKQPEPSEVLNDAIGNLIEFDLFGQPDHLAVRLSLPAPPLHSNGRWDKAHQQVIWESDIEGRTNATHFPFFCYASWVQAERQIPKEAFWRGDSGRRWIDALLPVARQSGQTVRRRVGQFRSEFAARSGIGGKD